MKTLRKGITTYFNIINPLINIKKDFTGKLLREVPGVLINTSTKRYSGVTLYITTNEVIMYDYHFNDKKKNLSTLEQSDVTTVISLNNNVIDEAVKETSTVGIGHVKTDKQAYAISFKDHLFLPGISPESMAGNAGGDLVTYWSKIIVFLGSKYKEEVENLSLLINKVLKKERISEIPKILPGSNTTISQVQAVFSSLYIPLFVTSIALTFITQSVLCLILTFILLFVPVIVLVIADKVTQHR